MSFLSDNFLGVIVTFLVVIIFLKLKKNYNYFADRGMPYYKNTWSDLINSLSLKVGNDIFDQWYSRSKKEGDTSYVGLRGIFGKHSILVLDPSMVQEILIKDFSFFQDHGFEMDFDQNPLTRHLFNMKGDQWRTLRHKLVPTFTSGKLKGMIPMMEECANKLVEEIKKHPGLQKDTNLKELFKKYSLAVIVSTAFGIEPESVKDPNCQFRKVIEGTVKPSKMLQWKFALSFAFPKLFKLLKLKIFSQEAEDFSLSFMKESFKHRKETGMKRNDFIQLLLELKEKGNVELDVKDLEQEEKDSIKVLQSKPPTAKLELTDALLTAQAFAFLVGGFENTAYLISVTTYLLSKHSDIQTRVRAEVEECQRRHGNLNYQALREMHLLQASVDEALRLHSPVPVLPRECSKQFTLKDGKTIDKGTVILLPTNAFHKDAQYWTDPNEFKPDRFLNGETIIPGTYFPFGDGPRICIAQRMALIIVKLMLAKMILNFEFLPSAKTKEPIKLHIVFGADNEGGFWGTFRKIKND